MKVVILGAGISGHTAALILRKKLSKEHDVIVVSPNRLWNWIPSNIWVGTGQMTADDVTFELEPIYKKQGIIFHQAKALDIFPEGNSTNNKPFVKIEFTNGNSKGAQLNLEYDYLINATGPKLNFSATPGLGPDGHSLSVCTFDHATHAAKELQSCIDAMKKGESKTFVVGTGHGLCTCEGAAFEYVFNLEYELVKNNVRDKAKIIFLTNEAQLGDFGVGGMNLKHNGFITPSSIFAESFFIERGVDWILGAHVRKVEKGQLEYEDLTGEIFNLKFDFAMLLPPFTGQPIKAYNKNNEDISSSVFNPANFMKVDADYTGKAYENWAPEDWPSTYQTQFKNIFAIGIAFAPPHQISKPMKNKNGTMIAPAPPRTGMPSAIMGRTVALSIIDMINGVSTTPTHSASLTDIGAACVASAGSNSLQGTAASMTMYPVVPNYKKYPKFGRSTTHTTGEIGTAGHWIKKLLHYAFIYKAKAKPFWWIIPE